MSDYQGADRQWPVIAGITGLAFILFIAGLLLYKEMAARRAPAQSDLPFTQTAEYVFQTGPVVNTPVISIITATASTTPPPTLTLTPSRTFTPTGTGIPIYTATAPASPTPGGPTLTASPTPTITATGPTPTLTPTPAINPCQPPQIPGNCEGTFTIQTYDYEQALIYSSSFPYPTGVDTRRMGKLQAKSYRMIMLENDSLRLAFLPELGGRLYQIGDKKTGRDLLYNSAVIKPTFWGPQEMTWWIPAGGVEWAFPADEHGYAWGLPWQATPTLKSDGTQTMALFFADQVTGWAITVTVTLPPTGRSFTITADIANRGSTATPGQFWANVVVPAGTGMRVGMPADQVIVHSTEKTEKIKVGQILDWQESYSHWGRWGTWFSVFAAPPTGNTVEVWPGGSGPGIRRAYHGAVTPGVKLFLFGTETNILEIVESDVYYYEVWTGITPDFDREITLAPGASHTWAETWTIIDR